MEKPDAPPDFEDTDSGKTWAIFEEIYDELVAAENANDEFNSLHEGYAVIEEEFIEFQTEVFKNPRKHPDRAALARKEAIQLAAMAVRLIKDVL